MSTAPDERIAAVAGMDPDDLRSMLALAAELCPAQFDEHVAREPSDDVKRMVIIGGIDLDDLISAVSRLAELAPDAFDACVAETARRRRKRDEALRDLRALRSYLRRRDEIVRAGRDAGLSNYRIVQESGLSKPTIIKIMKGDRPSTS